MPPETLFRAALLFPVLSCLSWFRFCLLQVLLKPIQIALHGGELHLWLVWAVRLAGQDDHSGRHTLGFEGVVEFVSLRDRNADIGVTLLDQGWCRNALDIEHCRVFRIHVRDLPS